MENIIDAILGLQKKREKRDIISKVMVAMKLDIV